MKYTNKMKIDGEFAMADLSKKAMDLYTNTDPLVVYEYEDSDGNKLYSFDGCLGSGEGLTFEELQDTFEELHDALEGDLDD